MNESNNHPNDIDTNSVQGQDQLDSYWDQQQLLNNQHRNNVHDRNTPEQDDEDYDDGFRDNDILGNDRNTNVDEEGDFD